MLVRILKKSFGGVEYGPEQRVLHLGGEGSAGVETLEFELPDEWEDMAVTVHVQHLDGTLPQPVLLGTDRCLVVDRTFTASEKGLWMLKAMGRDGYCALTRPARYECYETFSTEGDVEITPSQYEAFVAQVMSAANRAVDKATEAAAAADRAEQAKEEADGCVANAWSAVESIHGTVDKAKASADEAAAAAKRAESYAPKDGTVLSVNSKGGAVQLTAEDVGAIPKDEADLVKNVTLEGRTLTVETNDGVKRTYTLPDSSNLAAVTGVLDVAHGGTGKSTALTAADVGAVEEGSAGYLKSLQAKNNRLVVTLGDDNQTSFNLLERATPTVLGGIKVGANLTVQADGTLNGPEPYTLTSSKIAAALGFTPTVSSMSCSIVYDHSYTGTGEVGSSASPLWIPLNGDYDAIAVIRTKTADYAKGSELARQRVLFELLTMEAAGDTFKSNYVTLKGLPSDTFKAAGSVNAGLIVMDGIWNNAAVLMQYKNRTLKMYWTGSGSKQPGLVWNDSSYQYHVFGITLDSSVMTT